ncbi:hypothetical protein Sste5346_004129 [Sporothrix stenoceras]|uniref:Uncharacterized protein n=1 Tax=Sporothrix stenoceras TaxID=5173 RepID=A0ABR3Z9Y0_9PEZI
MVLKTETAHNSTSCISSACRTVTISLIIGVALLICMTVVVLWCCKRGQRKVKNTVVSGVMGLFSRSSKTAAGTADDEEQLRPQQPIPPALPAPRSYQPSSYTQRYEAPYEAPYYPEYQQQQQRQWQWQWQRQTQSRNVGRAASQNLSEKRTQELQSRRYETIPEETPVERQQRLTRLASTVASSM